jgi:hypothetical protein
MHALTAERATPKTHLCNAAFGVNALHSTTRFRTGFVPGLFQQAPGPHVISPQGATLLLKVTKNVPARLFDESPAGCHVITEAACEPVQVPS